MVITLKKAEVNIVVLTQRFSLLFALSFLFSYIFANPTPGLQAEVPIEELINEKVCIYKLDVINQTRLAAYSELKGVSTRENGNLKVSFGSYGSIQFYDKSCLLKTYDGHFTLTPEEDDITQLASFNRALFNLLESIPLLNNQHASLDHVAFVDTYLSRKNLAAFDKIYVRHILIKYGIFDQDQVTFRADWLPDHEYFVVDEKTNRLTKKEARQLKMVLTKDELRGWYLDIGAQVYVKNVKRKVSYASGEVISTNTHAFKLFVQDLYQQTAHFIQKNRIEILKMGKKEAAMLAFEMKMEGNAPENHPALNHVSLKKIELKNHPYQRDSWIPTMFSLLRYHNIPLHDPDIADILIKHPKFDVMLGFMTPSEQEKMTALLQ